MTGSPVPLSATLAALDVDPREALMRLSRLGCRLVQLSATQPGLRPRDLDAGARRGLRQRLQQLELAASGVDLWIPPGHYIDPAHCDRALAAVLGAIDMAADLGRVPVSVLFPPADDARPELPELLATMLAHAERHGVDLADHAIAPREPGATNGHRLGIGIDPAALLANACDPEAAVLGAGKRLVSARLSDLTVSGMRAPVAFGAAADADGQLDLERYAVALSIVGYARPVVIDARQWTDPWAGVVESMSAWAAIAR